MRILQDEKDQVDVCNSIFRRVRPGDVLLHLRPRALSGAGLSYLQNVASRTDVVYQDYYRNEHSRDPLLYQLTLSPVARVDERLGGDAAIRRPIVL